MAEKFGVPHVYGDPEELLRKEELDFVDIITEVPAHAPLVRLAAQYRVPVICQKPMAPDYATCQRMVQACEEAGIPFYVHENYRWQAPIRELKRIVDEGHIGRLFRGRFQFLHALEPFVWENQPLLKTLPRLIIADQGSHQLDLARFFFGEFQQNLLPAPARARRHRGRGCGLDLPADERCDRQRGDELRPQTEWKHFPEVAHLPGRDRGTLELGADFWIRLTTDAARRFTAARRPATPGPIRPTTSITPAWCRSTRISCAACAAARRRKTRARTTSRPCNSSTPPMSRRSGMPFAPLA